MEEYPDAVPPTMEDYPDPVPPAASAQDKNISGRSLFGRPDKALELVKRFSKRVPNADDETSDGSDTPSESALSLELEEITPYFRIVTSKFWRMMETKYYVLIQVIDSKINLIQPLLDILAAYRSHGQEMSNYVRLFVNALMKKTNCISITHLEATLISHGTFRTALRDCYIVIQNARRSSNITPQNCNLNGASDSANEDSQKSIGLPQNECDLNNTGAVSNGQRSGRESETNIASQRGRRESQTNIASRRVERESETNTAPPDFQPFLGDSSVRPKTVQEKSIKGLPQNGCEFNNTEVVSNGQRGGRESDTSIAPRGGRGSETNTVLPDFQPFLGDSSVRPKTLQEKKGKKERNKESNKESRAKKQKQREQRKERLERTTSIIPSDSSAQNKQTSQEISEASESRKDQNGTETNYKKIPENGQAGTDVRNIQIEDLQNFYQELIAMTEEANREGDYECQEILDSMTTHYRMTDILYFIFLASCGLRGASKVNELSTISGSATSQCSVMQSEPELNQTSIITCETTGFELRQVGADTLRAASKSKDGDKDVAEAVAAEAVAAEAETAEAETAEAGMAEVGMAEAGIAGANWNATAVTESSSSVTWQSDIRERIRRLLGLKPIEMCKGCGKNYRWPHLLHCFHRFCFPCVVKLYDAARQCFKCPLCELLTIVDTPWVGPRSLKIDTITAKQMFEAFLSPFCCTRCSSVEDAIKFCIACLQYLCAGCCHLHGVTASTAGHSLQNSDTKVGATPDGELTYMCPLNPGNIITQFCRLCGTVVCDICVDDHESHMLH